MRLLVIALAALSMTTMSGCVAEWLARGGSGNSDSVVSGSLA